MGPLTGLRQANPNIPEKKSTSNDENLKAEDAGLVLRGSRLDAKQSLESPVDFGQLFMGFSFFVIAAVLAITGMLFNFSLEQRSWQIDYMSTRRKRKE